jgi:hypothetical protein
MQHNRSRPPRHWSPDKPKPTLPMVQLPIFRVRYYDLEAYLARVYGMDGFDFLLATAAVAGLCPEYIVQNALPPAQDALERANRIRAGQWTKNVNLILNVLCIDGFIPAGHYIIDTHKQPDPIDAYKALLHRTLDPLHPDCIQFKSRHRNNRNFRQLAARLDQSLNKMLKEETRE